MKSKLPPYMNMSRKNNIKAKSNKCLYRDNDAEESDKGENGDEFHFSSCSGKRLL